MNADTPKVLIIDDEPLLLRSLQRILKHRYQTHPCSSAFDALDALKNDTYDVILCDLFMPRMDGRGFFQALSRDYPEMAGKVIFLSGDVGSPEMRSFLTGRAHLAKPFTIKNLLGTIDRVLFASESQRAVS
jgi:two-component system NtrC family sensor kinase